MDMNRRRISHRATSALLVSTIFLSSCAPGAQTIALTPTPTLDRKDVLEFKHHGEHVAITAVTFAGDSVSGVDWRYPTDPRHSYARADMSNVTVTRAQSAGGQAVGAVLGLGLLVGLAVVIVGHAVGGN